MDELDEVLDIAQRQKRSQIMRRYAAKIERKRELAQKRLAPEKNIKKRAYAQARQAVRKKFAGARGAEYEKLGPSEKIAIDRAIEKKSALIKKLALRLIPKIKQAEAKRLQSFTQGQALKNHGQGEGKAVSESLNSLFAESFPPMTNTSTSQLPGENGSNKNDVQTKAKKKAKTGDVIIYNRFGEGIVVSKSVFEGLSKKSEKTGIDIETLGEVYSRGCDAWEEGGKYTQQQYAFARVNSYINEGSSYYELDADLHGEELVEKRGLWDNIHAKRKRIKAGSGERMRKPGSKGAPTAQDFRDAQESVEIEESEMSLYDKIQAKRAEMRKNPEPEKEPPYKRKPALTAHDRDRRRLDKEDDEAQAQIRKRLRKEDVNLNELKTSTLKSYVNKAPASSENLVKAALYQRNEKKKAALLKKSQNRETGVRNAIDRIMQREETELDEMKTVTNRSHAKMLEVKVGGKAHSYKKYGWGLHHPTYGPLKDEKFNSKAEMKAAMEKHPHYNSKLSEETELDEMDISKYKMRVAKPKSNTEPKKTFMSVLDQVDIPAKHLNNARSVWNRTKNVDAVRKFLSSVKEDVDLEEASGWINNNSKWKEAVKSAHGDDVTFKTKVQPGVSGKKDTHATNSKGTVVGVYQHHNKMGRVYSEETESVGTKIRKNMEIVDRKPKTPGVYTKQAEVKNKIIDEEGNVENDPKKRLTGTDSLVRAYKKDTPGQGGGLNESFNIAFAAGVGVSLTAADLGMKAQGGFALHPSVIAEMEARELEEDAVSAEKKPVYMPPRRKNDGSYTAAKTVLRKSGRKIINAEEPKDVDSDEHDGK